MVGVSWRFCWRDRKYSGSDFGSASHVQGSRDSERIDAIIREDGDIERALDLADEEILENELGIGRIHAVWREEYGKKCRGED